MLLEAVTQKAVRPTCAAAELTAAREIVPEAADHIFVRKL